MASPTSGFQLSALPASNPWPTNIGKFDPMQPIANAQAQLGFLQNLQTFGPATNAAIAQKQEEQAQAQAGTTEAQVAGKRAAIQSGVLSSAGVPETMQQTGVLQSQLGLAAEQAKAAQFQRLAKFRASAQDEMPDVRDAVLKARANPDPDARATALAQVQVDHPWINQLPEYSELSASIENTRKAAEATALETVKGTQSIKRAQVLAQGRVEGANVAHTPAVQRLIDARAAAIDNNADDQEIALYDQAIAKANAIKPASPPDAQRIENLQSEADKAEAEGDTALAQALRNRVKRVTQPAARGEITPDQIASLTAALGGAPTTPASATTGTPAAAGAQAPADKFIVGTPYTDANGRVAIYKGNGQWQPQ